VKVASVVQNCVRTARQTCVATSLVYGNVELVGVFRSVCCQGGTVLWTMSLKEDVKDSIRKDSLAIIQIVVGYGICVHMESLNSVKVGSFFLRWCNICVILFIGSKEWPSTLGCFAKLYVWLLFRKVAVCSLYLVFVNDVTP